MSIFNDEEEKSHEWAEAKRQLTGSNGQLLKNGTKLRRKDSGLNHSFMVIDNRILAFNVQGKYLGRGSSGKAKLAEDETGRFFAVKVQNRAFGKSETDIAYDLNFSGEKTERTNEYLRTKEYLACRYLGRSLFACHEELNKTLSLDARYALLTQLALELHAFQTGLDSKTRTAYHHGDFYIRNVVIDEHNKPHIIDFGSSVSESLYLKDEHGELINSDTKNLLQEFVYQAPRYRNDKTWHGFMADMMNENLRFIEYAYPVTNNQIALKLTEPQNEAGEYTCLKYTKALTNMEELENIDSLEDALETGIIPLEELGLPPMEDSITMPSPLPQFYEIQDKILDAIRANGHEITIDFDASTRNETLRVLANKGNATALEIAETLTLCRFNLETHQEELMARAPELRLATIKLLQAESEPLLALYELIRTTHGEDSAIEASMKSFLLDNIHHQHPEDNLTDSVKTFLENVSEEDTSNLEAPLIELIQSIEHEKKILDYEQSRR